VAYAGSDAQFRCYAVPMSDLHVGGEVEAYCGGCKDVRWHVIVALVGDRPVKVECQSCHKQHGYRTSAAGASARGPRSSAAKPGKSEAAFDVSALQARAHEARAYAPAQTFKVGDVVRHPTFGLGLVQATPAPQKIDVRFASGGKLLVHAKA